LSALDALLDELADRLATRILSTSRHETYSSRDLPPRCSRRRFAELCRSGRVVGARREGREWVCAREAWEAERTRAYAPVVTKTTVKATSLDAKADALLARAGLRVVKGAR
jgi:hypothetical protein